MARQDAHIERDGEDCFKFSFMTEHGTLMGWVSVALRGARPDGRSREEKVEAAEDKIKALATEFIQSAEES